MVTKYIPVVFVRLDNERLIRGLFLLVALTTLKRSGWFDNKRYRRPHRTFLPIILFSTQILGIVPLSLAETAASWNPNVSCTAEIVAVRDVLGPSGTLSGSRYQVSSTEGGVPDKRALSPPCTITNISGEILSSFVEIRGVYLPSLIDEDCSTNYSVVNGGGPYPDRNGDGTPDTYCDSTGNIHPIGSSGSIHIEFDHDWKAAGYCGPGTQPCDNAAILQYLSSGSISLDVQGFVYWDISHWELHPFTGWRLSQLSTSISYSPSNPAPSSPVSFAATARGGAPPYMFTWSFGDGTSGAGATVSHTYSTEGSFNVTLTTSDSGGHTVASSRVVVVRAQTSYTFTPTDDAYVQQDTPSANYGSATTVTADNSPVKNILLKFDVQVSGEVQGATLRLYQVDSSDRGGDFHNASSNWTEGAVSWSNAPPADSLVLFSLGPVSPNSWYDVDMTSVVTGSVIISLRVTSPSADGSHFSSKEGINSPRLVVNVASSNVPPVLQVPSAKVVDEENFLGLNIIATDEQSQTVAIIATALPAGASFTSTPSTGTTTGTLAWTPSENQGPGTYSVTFRATDSLGSQSNATLTITVQEVNRHPAVIVPVSLFASVGTNLTLFVTVTDPDVPSNTLILSTTGLAANMQFDPATRRFMFSPDSSQTNATFSVTFTAVDNGTPALSDSETVLITVLAATGGGGGGRYLMS